MSAGGFTNAYGDEDSKIICTTDDNGAPRTSTVHKEAPNTWVAFDENGDSKLANNLSSRNSVLRPKGRDQRP